MTISLIKNAQVKNHLPSWLDRLWNDICWICSKQKIRQNGGFLTFCEKPIGGKNILRKGCTIESMQKQIWNHDTLKKPVKHVLLPWIIQEKIKVTVLLLQISPTPQDESLFSEWQFFVVHTVNEALTPHHACVSFFCWTDFGLDGCWELHRIATANTMIWFFKGLIGKLVIPFLIYEINSWKSKERN